MVDLDVIPFRIGPHGDLDGSYPHLELSDDGSVTAAAAAAAPPLVRPPCVIVGVVSRVDEVMGERQRHVVVDTVLVPDGRVELVGEDDDAVEVVEGEELLPADLLKQVFDVGAFALVDAEVPAEAIFIHVMRSAAGASAGVEGEEGANVLGRWRGLGRRRRAVPTVKAAALVRRRRPHLASYLLSLQCAHARS